jgi:hypothetical protein
MEEQSVRNIGDIKINVKFYIDIMRYKMPEKLNYMPPIKKIITFSKNPAECPGFYAKLLLLLYLS